MALDTKHRSSIYTKLLGTLGEEDATVLMDQFPALEADELVTKEFLRAELAELRTEMHQLGHRLMTWTITTMLAGISVAVTLAYAVGRVTS